MSYGKTSDEKILPSAKLLMYHPATNKGVSGKHACMPPKYGTHGEQVKSSVSIVTFGAEKLAMSSPPRKERRLSECLTTRATGVVAII